MRIFSRKKKTNPELLCQPWGGRMGGKKEFVSLAWRKISFSLLTQHRSICCQPTGEPRPRGSSQGCKTINNETRTWQRSTCAGTHLARLCSRKSWGAAPQRGGRCGGRGGPGRALKPPQTMAGHGNTSSLPRGKTEGTMRKCFGSPHPFCLLFYIFFPQP